MGQTQGMAHCRPPSEEVAVPPWFTGAKDTPRRSWALEELEGQREAALLQGSAEVLQEEGVQDWQVRQAV